MFCFSSHSHRKERGKSKFSRDGLASDFSQSVSALNQLAVPDSPGIVNACHSDSNITVSSSIWKNAGKIKSRIINSEWMKSKPHSPKNSSNENLSKSDIECSGVTTAFRVSGDLNYIDDNEISSSVSVINVPEADVNNVNITVDVTNYDASNVLVENNCSDVEGQINAFEKNNSISLTCKNNCVRSPPRELALHSSLLLNPVGDSEYPSSSGNSSSSSNGIAPIASPELLTPPESGVSSPVSCPDVTLDPVLFLQRPSPRLRCKLLHEGDVQVCYLNHTRTIVSKVLSSKFLRRWESHHVYLGDSEISSKSSSGCLELPLPYTSLLDAYVVSRFENGNKYCIRLAVSDGSYLLQASNAFLRDQWLHSIKWKRSMHKYRSILRESSRPEVILKEIKNLVDFSIKSPVRDGSSLTVPIEIISQVLDGEKTWDLRFCREELILAIAPLLENTTPTTELCQFFSEHCVLHPRSPVIAQVFTPIVNRILKRNVDFGRSPLMRQFVADFIKALYSQNNGDEAVQLFIKNIHGHGCCCPHPRVLPNLVAANLAAIFSHYEERRNLLVLTDNETDSADRSQAVTLLDYQLQCYITLFLAISELEDWRPGLAQLLQPVPLPLDAINQEMFSKALIPVIRSIATDRRCEVHSLVLGVREGKEGWFQVYCPSSTSCTDGGELWCQMLETLMECCCRRKSFLQDLVKQVGAVLLMALRDHAVAQDILCLLLEWRLLPMEDQQLQAVTTLQSTDKGKEKYRELCKRQDHLRELQQKGGPKKLTLPSRSTDADVARLLSWGCFGNLECLSLAFTHVTSACAQHLIKLPSLRYLNLWATQFGDAGLQMIAEHLDKLQFLNLCETQVSDRGISALIGMPNLKKLNLNSTKLTLATLEKLKEGLPSLQELDIRYTDAW